MYAEMQDYDEESDNEDTLIKDLETKMGLVDSQGKKEEAVQQEPAQKKEEDQMLDDLLDDLVGNDTH